MGKTKQTKLIYIIIKKIFLKTKIHLIQVIMLTIL